MANDAARFEDAPEDLVKSAPEPKIQIQFTGHIASRTNDSDCSADDYSDDDDYYDERFRPVKTSASTTANKERTSNSYQPQEKVLRKFASKIRVEKYDGPTTLPNHISTALSEHSKNQAVKHVKSRDKSDRATVETVLDPRTRMIVYKFLSRNVISEINGCISTGKEANVYHATCNNGKPDCAVKIFKTSILTFKDRDRYVTGEFRFRHGYSKHNPRKMVRMWAEKEMRNLLRLEAAGIPVPHPVILRNHVLVMEFVGTDGWPAPLLKDVKLTEGKARELYLSAVRIIRDIYQKAMLVHADLSEFNILFSDGQLRIIDVSQSVEHDHPSALEFLRKDCNNITEFFKKFGVPVMSLRALFNFVTDLSITDDNIEKYLETAEEIALQNQDTNEDANEDEVEEEVFKKSFIPRTLDEVVHFAQDLKKVDTKKDGEVLYREVLGLSNNMRSASTKPRLLEDKPSEEQSDEEDEEEDDEEEEDEDSDDMDVQDEEGEEGKPEASVHNNSCHKKLSKEDNKDRKRLFKAAQKESRETKTPKHIKKSRDKKQKK